MKSIRELSDLDLAGLGSALSEAVIAAAGFEYLETVVLVQRAARAVGAEAINRRSGNPPAPRLFPEASISLIQHKFLRSLCEHLVANMRSRSFDDAAAFLMERAALEVSIDASSARHLHGVELRTLQ